ncbi:putative transcription factor MYB family [Helianthus annuus]|nr:putative transcription factor MYB family [Helianthus annuus]KAJ0783707.1 putative transcription factor MYB family [Helianthus annuus]
MDISNSPSSEPTLALPPPATRRLPPPCWSHDETVALIEAYREKWYSLRRGNLRATHWQEVADGVAARCPMGNPPKTSIQCRHKMEKLRKRYRAEIQRIGNVPNGHRYPSSWVHFKIMDSMELGSSCSDPGNQDDEEEDMGGGEDGGDELMLYPKGIKQAIAIPLNRRYSGVGSPNGVGGGGGNGNGIGNGVRIKIPNSVAMPPPQASVSAYYNNRSNGLNGLNGLNEVNSFDDFPPSMNPGYGAGRGPRNGYTKDGFVKMERMKMDMARELESMRMKMEMKRTEMILESQQKLVDSFSKTVLEKNKKVKRMPTPES